MFDGAKFDIHKALSNTFQVTHSFTMGSQVAPPAYNFGVFYVHGGVFATGNIDHEGGLQGRGTYTAFGDKLALKFVTHMGTLPGQSMNQVEADYKGLDYGLNAKVVNPSQSGTGIFVFSYLQSVSKNLALGIEAAHQKHSPTESGETHLGFVGRYSGKDYVFTTSLTQQGAVQSSYFHKVSERCEMGAEIQMNTAGQERKEALCSFGGKWDFRNASFRGQIDTTGKVSAILEERFAPIASLLLSGEIDHMKGSSKFGIGLQMDF
jgi:mitochondrial import receptor subunit TOM40